METKTMIREVKHVAEKHKNDRKFTGQTVITDMCNDIIPKLEKLSEYETAEEEGRLVVLPCKVGDALFCFSRGKIYPFKVRCIRVYEERVEIELWYAGDEENLKFWHITIAEQDVGYKFFFAREETEKALKEVNYPSSTPMD